MTTITAPRMGSLFAGMGGLDLAVHEVTRAKSVWCSENDPGAASVLRHHWPKVPNLGDITGIDWTKVPPVDILVGGFPCTDVSVAGRRVGMVRYGTPNRSGLWSHMAQAINLLRPLLVVAENVRGLTSAKADTNPDLLHCDQCVADAEGQSMRALGAVLGDLADIGYDAAWHGLRASDAGAPHQRFRVFILAWPADAQHPRLEDRDRVGGDACAQLPAAERNGSGHGRVTELLPTPRANSSTGAGTRGEGGPNLQTAVTLLPTPSVPDGKGGHVNRSGDRQGELLLNGVARSLVDATDWGVYESAIRRWEAITRPAPPPTEIGPRGGQRLSPGFVEWMMGLPAGHVTDVPGLSRNQQLAILGNGVVRQQAVMALRYLFDALAVAEAA